MPLVTHKRAFGISALGQKQTLGKLRLMSALPPKADIAERRRQVRFVPKADILRCEKKCRYSITSSARASTIAGTLRPKALAVLVLITSSNLVGC